MDEPHRAREPEVEPWVTPGPIEVDEGSPQDDGDPEADVRRDDGQGVPPEARGADVLERLPAP